MKKDLSLKDKYSLPRKKNGSLKARKCIINGSKILINNDSKIKRNPLSWNKKKTKNSTSAVCNPSRPSKTGEFAKNQ